MRRDLCLSPSFEFELASAGDLLFACEIDATATAGLTARDPLPALSVRGCTVLYAGKPIYETVSPDAAIIYLDRHINVYE